MNTIRIRRGLAGARPVLQAEEFGFSTDTKQLHIGDGTVNHEVLLHSLYNAGTFLYATADNTPEVKTPAAVMGILSGSAIAAFGLNNQRLTGLAEPTVETDAVTKGYADSIASGLDAKESVRVATTTALPAVTAAGAGAGKTLTANAVGVLTIDGVNTVLNDRILIKDQAAGADNGIYVVTIEGTAGVAFVLTRAADADANVTGGMFTFVTEGTDNGNEGWVLTTNDPITIDTTALTFGQFSSVGVGATTFVGLTDTPADFVGAGLNIVRVNAGATALEYTDFATAYLDNVPANAEVGKGITSNWAFDHAAAVSGTHGAGANTLLHSASTIDGGTW